VREYEIVQRFFGALAEKHAGALSLKDDAAFLSAAPGQQLVITTDTCIEGIHFRPQDPPALIAQKALRVNLSDLAAMGAQPLGYTLTLGLPAHCSHDAWLEAFTAGLKADQEEFEITLIGGDTVLSPERLIVGMTAFGQVRSPLHLHRNAAMPGDRIYVSGTIGDAFLGLKILEGRLDVLHQTFVDHLINRYQRPTPRVHLGQSLFEIAHAATDISDGFVVNLSHISGGSGLVAFVRLEDIPLSPAFQKVLSRYEDEERLALLKEALTFGDDYELIFTVAPHYGEEIEFLAQRHNIPLTLVGHLGAHNPLSAAQATFLENDKREEVNLNSQAVQDYVQIIDAEGRPLSFNSFSYDHFSKSGAQ
jgi:thiamine-monophosphate kinase